MLRDIGDFFDSFMQLATDPAQMRSALIVAAGAAFVSFFIGRWFGARRTGDKDLDKIKEELAEAKKQLAWAQAEIEALRSELAEAKSRLAKYQDLVTALQGEEDELWRLRGSGRAPEVSRLERYPGRIITFANLKGGVGKTTLAAHMARYFDAKGKRVLAIDLDYQGSLSDMLFRAAGYLEAPRSKTDVIFEGGMTPESLLNQVDRLQALQGRQQVLQRTHLLPSGFSLNRAENRAMLNWLLGETKDDVRFNLLRLLVSNQVADAYDIVIIDTPPRWSTGTISALAASTHVVVPTILNTLSAANVPVFLKSALTLMRNDLNPYLRLASVIGTMTKRQVLDEKERAVYTGLRDAVKEVWGDGDGVFEVTIPDKASIYDEAGSRLSDEQLFAPMGDELWERVRKK